MSVVLSTLPDDWKHPVDLVESSGRDHRGDPTPGVTTRVDGCLLAVQESSDLDNLNSNPTLKAKLFMPTGSVVNSTSRIHTLAPASVVGKWAVDGKPISWPFGVEVRLEWEGELDD